MGLPQFGKQGTILLLCAINMLNYVDRGIIPGAPEKFQNFITRTLHIEVTDQSLYLGLLASSFIASYSICSILFGYLVRFIRPFRMIAFGMSVWVVAVVCCGASYTMDSYYFLMFGRVLSGVGEASFQCCATPFINMHAPKANRALWMGVYLSSITVGTAMGYIYGSLIASTSLKWGGAFYIEGVVMVGLILICLFCIPEELDRIPKDVERESLVVDTPVNVVDNLMSHKSSEYKEVPEKDEPSTFWTRWWFIFKNPTFQLIVMGYAAYTFSLAALSVFSPVILIGLGMYDTEAQVSTAFGGLIVIAGTVGTPIGGIVLDRMSKRGGSVNVSGPERSYIATKLMFGCMTFAFAFALLMMAFTNSRLVFLGLLAICFLFLCALAPAETVAIMELFPASYHGMAIAGNTLLIHAFGDVPSPIILGMLKDSWAPRCGTVELNGKAELNPDCHLDHSGLVNVLLFPVLWLTWGVLLWAAAVFVLRRTIMKQKRQSTVVTVG